MLDVDETALSNWSELKSTQFHYDKARWLSWEQEEAAVAIQPILALYHYYWARRGGAPGDRR